MNAAEVMTTALVTVGPETPLVEAVQLMLKERISGLPVVDGAGQLLGILSEGDLLRRHEIGTERYAPRWIELYRKPALAGEYARAHGRKVGDVMSPRVDCIDPDASLSELVDLMEQRQINRVPVVRDGRLLGMVSRSDLLRAFVSAAAAPTPTTVDDETIRTGIEAELSGKAWHVPAGVRIAVSQGVVELQGSIPDERYRAALRVAAENVPGVVSVVDRLVMGGVEEPPELVRHAPKILPLTEGPGLSLE